MKNRGYKPLHFEKQEIVVERTRDEKTILENDVEQVRENYNNFLDSTNDLLFVIDLKGEILHINKTVTKRLGYIEADLIGRSVLQVYPENRREEAEKSIEDILAADLDVSSVPFITKNGLMIPVETSLVRGEWNGQPVLFGVAKDISKQKKSEEKFTRAFQTGGVLMAISSIEEGRFMDVNETFINTLDFQRADVVGKSANELDLFFDPEQREKIKKQYETFGSAHGIEVVLKGKDNKNHTMLVSVDPIETENQDLPCWLTTMVDISERKRIEQKVAASEAKHKAMINNISDVITIIDQKGIVKYKSANIEKWFGWLPQELINTDICLTVHPDDVEIVLKAFHALQEKDGLIKNLEYRFMCKNGNYKDIEMTAVNLLNDININGILMNYKDITEHKKIAEKILFLNYHDVLTGLYNRRFYEKEIIRMDTEDNLPISIIMGDVNGLKLINDAFGHDKGDELLQKAANSIQNACRSEEIIARYGGDEFVILLPKTEIEAAHEIISRIKEIFANELVNTIRGSISFGCDSKIIAGDNIFKTLKNAEDNMYKNKTHESKSNRGNTINTIISILNKKSPREESNAKEVSAVCQSIGRAMGLSPSKITKLKMAGLLHDIGTIAIEQRVLNNPGKLTKKQWSEVKRHSDIGYRILISSPEMIDLAEFIRAHHERWDGKGYPVGLKSEKIPMEARIIALADSYVAMTSPRLYKSVLSKAEAIEEIQKNAGIQFDAEIAKVFVEKVLGEKWIELV